MVLASPAGPRSPQDGPKPGQDGPRSAQDVSKTVLKVIFSLLNIDFDFESFWDRFWLHFGSQNASLWAPFCRSKSIKKMIGLFIDFWSSQGGVVTIDPV